MKDPLEQNIRQTLHRMSASIPAAEGNYGAIERRITSRRRTLVVMVASSLTIIAVAAVAMKQRDLPESVRVVTEPSEQGAGEGRAEQAGFAVRSMTDIVFVDDRVGFSIADNYVGRSDDGGRSWHRVGILPVVEGFADEGWSVVFSDRRNGYLFGRGFFKTDDGGASWLAVNTSAKGEEARVVQSVVPIESSVWAASACPTEAECEAEVSFSVDGGHTWSVTEGAPNIDGDRVLLVRVSSENAYLSATTSDIEPAVAVTTDGGRTWEKVGHPCTGASFLRMAATPGTRGREMWMVCGAEPGAGSAEKAVFRSRDGGKRWDVVASSGVPGIAPRTGQLSSTGLLSDLAVVSSEDAWIAAGTGGLLRTFDGGRTWKPAFRTDAADAGVSKITMLDARHGWSLADQGLWATTDGINWTHRVGGDQTERSW